jgi:uncharacterized membrane protein YfcA
MDNCWLLILIGLVVGALGTLIGAGGGFILVPVLLFLYPSMPPAILTAVSMAIVACNALSGSVAYARAGRIDYKAGILFSVFTIPGSVLGVWVTRYIPKYLFTVFFGGLLVVLAFYLFFKKEGPARTAPVTTGKAKTYHEITDRDGEIFRYSYNQYLGCIISLLVGFVSPILGIGGGIIHVPALISWLQFPVHIATATSHFILAVMSVVSVIVHITEGNYDDPHIRKLVLYLAIGVIAGAQTGAYFSHRVKGDAIMKALAVSLGLVGIRILLGNI